MFGVAVLAIAGCGMLLFLAARADRPKHLAISLPVAQPAHVALGIYAAIGCVCGVIVGYALSRPQPGFDYWIVNHQDVWLWALMGAFVGAAAKFLRQRGL